MKSLGVLFRVPLVGFHVWCSETYRTSFFTAPYSIIILILKSKVILHKNHTSIEYIMIFMSTIIKVSKKEMADNAAIYCSICFPKNADAVSASFNSSSPNFSPLCLDSIITAPIASPSAITGDIT